ncbi:streptomycin 3''-adenylyltransferase [Sporosarcina luteola]|uniref:Spectinomycin 9-adenylyltransferase n=1 Tax=Sporosarcina luteola TaxID=582850 RepID=A0A511ZCR2_9BACL|nr:aminoglycoside adenylyltransferase domain-containing protein [Sporosarcina luteola]GEN85240.1 streptomycin 3''-adenylyltransferase [Sporosarcina luteola]
MCYDRETRPSDIEKFIYDLKEEIKKILKENFIGFYIHGSLAMGGFNPNSSDIDILVVTIKTIKVDTKRLLAQFFLNHSNLPFPVETSFLNREQLKDWQHPCSFDFHYSEFWRERYQNDLLSDTSNFLNDDTSTDTDLAAHITITNHRGICVEGEPIDKVFPSVPRLDYISSIIGDFEDCLQNIKVDPIYCTLNSIRVYWYLKEGVISSKLEAGIWGCRVLPKYFSKIVRNVVNIYTGEDDEWPLSIEELIFLRDYLEERVQGLLQK